MPPFRSNHSRSPFDNEFVELRAVLPHPHSYVEFRISRNLLWAIIVSLLVHLAALIWLHWPTPVLKSSANAGSQAPLDVQINPAAPLIAPTVKPAQAQTQPQPSPPKPQHRTVPRPPSLKPILAVPTRQPAALPAPAQNVPPDMSSYINMVRSHNHTTTETASAPQAGSAEDARMANIQRNLQDPGGGGIFQINHMDDESATFLFRGWDNATWSNPNKQMFSVVSDAHTDIEHAIVRKMIAIIREKHHDTIDWDSHRLGQVVTISVKPEDNAGLEAFLLKEFFYDNPGAAQR